MEYLIIAVDKELKVHDWTPFINKFDTNNINLVIKGDLITGSLRLLSMHNWKYLNAFQSGKYTHFLLEKPLTIIRNDSQSTVINNNQTNDDFSNYIEITPNHLEEEDTDNISHHTYENMD
jgi:hypothetical protein|tara:strand:- start:645 stop:1004 length:360 start_codon:yes stop_codon:yes gene_type:complete